MEELFRYKNIAVIPKARMLEGEEPRQWSADYMLKMDNGSGATVQCRAAPGIFNSLSEAISAIIPHARHVIDGLPEMPRA